MNARVLGKLYPCSLVLIGNKANKKWIYIHYSNKANGTSVSGWVLSKYLTR